MSARHEIKVVPPYFDALKDGSKTFEVRKNDRAYQRGDVLILQEWHPYAGGGSRCACGQWFTIRDGGHLTHRAEGRTITFVYSGDPRFGGIEPGYVVLGLSAPPAASSSSERP